MKNLVRAIVQMAVLVNAHAAMAQGGNLFGDDPTLKSIKLGPDNPLAVQLDQALPQVGDESTIIAGSIITKKAVIVDAPGEYLITCTTTGGGRRPSKFQGCLVEDGGESGQQLDVLTLTFKALLLKLGGTLVLPVPGFPYCHTRAC